MHAAHRFLLYALLGVLGISLVIPGLLGMFRPGSGRTWLQAQTPDVHNQLRAMNGMMAAIGLMALWALFKLDQARNLVMALGLVMACVAAARLYSFFADGLPGPATWRYLAVEVVIAAVFLGWPPPGSG